MSDQFCACGNRDGTNDECERCRLIAQLTAAQQRVKELERENKRVIDDLAQFNAQLLDKSRDRIDALTAENAKLRELLRELEQFIRERVADRSTMCVKRGGGYHSRRICLEAEKLLESATDRIKAALEPNHDA